MQFLTFVHKYYIDAIVCISMYVFARFMLAPTMLWCVANQFMQRQSNRHLYTIIPYMPLILLPNMVATLWALEGITHICGNTNFEMLLKGRRCFSTTHAMKIPHLFGDQSWWKGIQKRTRYNGSEIAVGIVLIFFIQMIYNILTIKGAIALLCWSSMLRRKKQYKRKVR